MRSMRFRDQMKGREQSISLYLEPSLNNMHTPSHPHNQQNLASWPLLTPVVITCYYGNSEGRTRLQLYSSCSQFPTDPVGVFVLKEVNVSSMTLSSIRLRGCTGVNSGEASRLSWERDTVGSREGERNESEKERGKWSQRRRDRKWVEEQEEEEKVVVQMEEWER